MTILRAIFILAAVLYLGFGLKRFGLGFELYTSPRYVRNPPPTGLWGPIRFLSRDTWTEEGLRERDRLMLWQLGLMLLFIVAPFLW